MIVFLSACFVLRLRRVLKPYLGDREAAYVNYMLTAFQDWKEGYFGDNYKRLAQVKVKYDPLGLFSKPYTIES